MCEHACDVIIIPLSFIILLSFRVKTLRMASAQVVETSVANKGPSQDSNHSDDHFHSRYVTPGFKPFS